MVPAASPPNDVEYVRVKTDPCGRAGIDWILTQSGVPVGAAAYIGRGQVVERQGRAGSRPLETIRFYEEEVNAAEAAGYFAAAGHYVPNILNVIQQGVQPRPRRPCRAQRTSGFAT